jgi:hypothetical protein
MITKSALSPTLIKPDQKTPKAMIVTKLHDGSIHLDMSCTAKAILKIDEVPSAQLWIAEPE